MKCYACTVNSGAPNSLERMTMRTKEVHLEAHFFGFVLFYEMNTMKLKWMFAGR